MNGTNYVNVTYTAAIIFLLLVAFMIIAAIVLTVKEYNEKRAQEKEQEEDYDEFDFYDKKEVIDEYREIRDDRQELIGHYNKLMDQYQDVKRKCGYYESEYYRMSEELKEKDEKIRWLLDMRQNQEIAMERKNVEGCIEDSGNNENGAESERRENVSI